MAYFIGSLLERKIEEYDLAELDKKLADIAAGTDGSWPTGGYVILASPALLEPTRIVIYSMLHSHQLKGLFTVRINYAESVVAIDMKTAGKQTVQQTLQKRTGGICLASTGPGYRPPAEVPVVPEDLSGIFSDDLSFEPAAVGNGSNGSIDEEK